MKHNVTQLEGKNEPVNSVLGNYFIELELGNYQGEEVSSIPETCNKFTSAQVNLGEKEVNLMFYYYYFLNTDHVMVKFLHGTSMKHV